MKKIFLLAIVISFYACNNKKVAPTVDYKQETLDVTTSIYPESIEKVFKAHGGLDRWNAMNTLEFTMQKPNGAEVTTTNLKNRKSLIDTPNHTIGFNGKDVWLQTKGEEAYKGKPKFYYNLMFYFYGMPFILADSGIIYKDAEPLVFEGVTYPGVNISYEAGVGESPEDEYIIYYNPKTFKMEWLAYTVTYFSNKKAKDFHFRRYSNWQSVNGLLLPETMVAYNSENNKPTTVKRESKFTNVKISESKPNANMFEIPLGAKVVE